MSSAKKRETILAHISGSLILFRNDENHIGFKKNKVVSKL